MSETPEPADAADALAVALCHVQAAQFQARLDAGTARPNVPANARAIHASTGLPAAPSPQNARSRGDVSRISLLR
jgi:hypothetical protein